MLEIAVCDDNGKDLDSIIEKLHEICAKMNAEQIGGILKPLIPTTYTGNVLLDILLSEKIRQVEDRGIGLLNVRKSIDKYDGDLKLRESNGKFIAEFFLNT